MRKKTVTVIATTSNYVSMRLNWIDRLFEPRIDRSSERHARTIATARGRSEPLYRDIAITLCHALTAGRSVVHPPVNHWCTVDQLPINRPSTTHNYPPTNGRSRADRAPVTVDRKPVNCSPIDDRRMANKWPSRTVTTNPTYDQ